MKIAIILPDLRGGGVERVRLVLAREFARQGHEVEFALMCARGELLEEAMAEFPIVELGAGRLRAVPLALARYLRRSQTDALLVAMWPLTALAVLGRRLARRNVNIIISDHGMLSRQYGGHGRFHGAMLRFSIAMTYPRAEARVGVSRGVVLDLAHLSGMDPNRFTVINNPVPFPSGASSAAVADAERRWGRAEGKRILTVGRFKSVKNHSLLLKAFSSLVRRCEASLMFVGNGELEPELRAQAASLGVDRRVIFAGFQPNPIPFYHTADLFVLSSDYEGFGNVIIEALACGTPVVSTDCPTGPREILEDGIYGRLVPVGDEGALARALEDALSVDWDTALLKKRAADFTPEHAAIKYLDLLSGVAVNEYDRGIKADRFIRPDNQFGKSGICRADWSRREREINNRRGNPTAMRRSV
ncbi:glycosyltransferase [Fodinicurvata sp. EGI_FJ10296]|uniref:glycosyltransferase n=1 Tax=Fodinicurvata sp. EGI_FJ10296 TaxID=3231908 RepID=UPI003456E59F